MELARSANADAPQSVKPKDVRNDKPLALTDMQTIKKKALT